MPNKAPIREAVVQWYHANARPLPWRAEDVTAWGVLVSEIMAQQTPVARVVGPWEQWQRRWPSPRDLAEADSAEVLRAWGSLGYPRRALRLRDAARQLADDGNEVPEDEAYLLRLPGIGRYTAAAVMAFAFRRRSVVLDTNIRRVLARLDGGQESVSNTETAAERRRAIEWLPAGDSDCAEWSQAVMEFGALVCTARSPICQDCPVRQQCRWVAAGQPRFDGPKRRAQAWAGTDRQCRGRIMGALRVHEAVAPADIAWTDLQQLERCVLSLIHDGLAHREGERLRIGSNPAVDA